jgi:hypothetical protein
MSVEGDASTYASTTASCQASPLVTFFGIQEDGLETYRCDGNTTINSATTDASVLNRRDTSTIDSTTAAEKRLGPILRWERPGAACAALAVCLSLCFAADVLGHTLIGIALDLLLAVSAAVAVHQLFSAAAKAPAAAGCRPLAAVRESIPVVLGSALPPPPPPPARLSFFSSPP